MNVLFGDVLCDKGNHHEFTDDLHSLKTSSTVCTSSKFADVLRSQKRQVLFVLV